MSDKYETVAEAEALLIATRDRRSGVVSVMVSGIVDQEGELFGPVRELLTQCRTAGVHRKVRVAHMAGGWAWWSIYRVWDTCPLHIEHTCRASVPEMRGAEEDALIPERQSA